MSYWSNLKTCVQSHLLSCELSFKCVLFAKGSFPADFSSSFCAVAFSAFKEKDKHIKFLCFEDQTNSIEAYI